MDRPQHLALSICFCLFSCTGKANIPAYYKLPAAELAELVNLNVEVLLDSLDLQLLESAIFYETNIQRGLFGLEPLRYQNGLHSGARGHSHEMVDLSYFAHSSPISENETVKMRLEHAGIKHGLIGENIAIHPLEKRQEMMVMLSDSIAPSKYAWRNKGVKYTYRQFAHDLVRRWLYSSPHRRNILSPGYRFLGVGATPGRFQNRDVFYVTQNFSSTNY